MRSSFGIRSSNAINTHSQIGGPVSIISAIKPSHSISKQLKFNIADEIQNFEKLLDPKAMAATTSSNGYLYIVYPNKDIYYGQHNNGQPSGQGVYIFLSMSSQSDRQLYYYIGKFENGQFNGFGKLCRSGSIEGIYVYQGYWKNGKRQTEGRQNYQDGSAHYIGQWLNDQRQGQGQLFIPNTQAHYKGQWRNGSMNGEGKLTIQSGPFRTVYQGIWQNDNLDRGIIRYYTKDGKLFGEYNGGIKNLLRDGQGNYSQGNFVFQGHFLKDEIVGNNAQLVNRADKGYTVKGDFSQPILSRLSADIRYINNDIFNGLVDINSNSTILRKEGKYIFSNGKEVNGVFKDNPEGKLIVN